MKKDFYIEKAEMLTGVTIVILYLLMNRLLQKALAGDATEKLLKRNLNNGI